MMYRILVTGSTGFVGSALVSLLLENKGVEIYSLTNDDGDGEKVNKAVQDASNGFERTAELPARIIPVCIKNFHDDSELKKTIHWISPHEVWHIAAHMSYDHSEFAPSFQFNALLSGKLLKFSAGTSKKYYFISTTGVAGPGDSLEKAKLVPEALLNDFEILNPYTVSKCFAEYILVKSAAELNIQLTILRLGSVIGHSRTGWVNRTRYGYYSYLCMLNRFRKKYDAFYLNVDPEKRFPVIHIDHCMELMDCLRNRKHPEPMEIFHVVNQGLFTVRQHFALFEQAANQSMKIEYGEGLSAANRHFNRINKDNNKFLNTCHSFSMGKLQKAVGEKNLPPNLTEQGLTNVISGYLDEQHP